MGIVNLDGTPLSYDTPKCRPYKDTRTLAEKLEDAYSRFRSNIFAINKFHSSELGEKDMKVYGFYRGDFDAVFRIHTNRTPDTITPQELERLTIGTGCELIGGDSARGVLLFALKKE